MKKALAAVLSLALGTSAALAFQVEAPAPPAPAPGPVGIRARAPGLTGTISSIAGTTYTIKTMRGVEQKVVITSATEIRLPDRTVGKVSDLKVGTFVSVTGTPDAAATVAATRVNIQNPSVMGEIIGISKDRITINAMQMPAMGRRNAPPASEPAPQTAKPMAFIITQNTAFGPRNNPGTVADFKIGDRVMIQYKGAEALSVRAFRAGGFGRQGGPNGQNRPRRGAPAGNQIGQPVPDQGEAAG